MASIQRAVKMFEFTGHFCISKSKSKLTKWSKREEVGLGRPLNPLAVAHKWA
jgi:hypothetical protein